MNYEILSKKGQVINTIVADADFMATQYPDGNYREVAQIVSEPPALEQISIPRHISVGAFFDRFGTTKYTILADTNPTVQALIKDVSVRKFINLDDANLPVGLQLVKDTGHDIDIDAILTSEILPSERP